MSFKLMSKAGPASDCTSLYYISFYKEYTVAEFIGEVLTKYPNEWGNIIIKKQHDMSGACLGHVDYSHGELVGKKDIRMKELLDYKIIHGSAHGGWSAMNYVLFISKN